RQNREFAFTKLMVCGLCGSGISAEEKYKTLSDGTAAKYIYYGCTRGKDRNCKNTYIREEELIEQLLLLVDRLDLNELGIRMKLEAEAKRFGRFQKAISAARGQTKVDVTDVDLRAYAKYLLKEGSVTEKRELLINLKSKLIYKDKQISFAQ
ncbi:MAG: recombinase zinc beta ribbon domain-containing protein, partial [Patescibacteria group bacterium]